jgi:hypothetical protein
MGFSNASAFVNGRSKARAQPKMSEVKPKSVFGPQNVRLEEGRYTWHRILQCNFKSSGNAGAQLPLDRGTASKPPVDAARSNPPVRLGMVAVLHALPQRHGGQAVGRLPGSHQVHPDGEFQRAHNGSQHTAGGCGVFSDARRRSRDVSGPVCGSFNIRQYGTARCLPVQQQRMDRMPGVDFPSYEMGRRCAEPVPAHSLDNARVHHIVALLGTRGSVTVFTRTAGTTTPSASSNSRRVRSM